MYQRRPVDVISLGGNALWNPEDPRVEVQREVCSHVCELIGARAREARGERGTAVTYGNGPHVGIMQLRVEAGLQLEEPLHDVPLSALVANTQSAIGLMLQQKIRSALLGESPLGNFQQRLDKASNVITLTTEVVVDPKSVAFDFPSKPVGLWMTEDEAKAKMDAEPGCVIKNVKPNAEKGKGWRRVVPSPEPQAIVEFAAIRDNLFAGKTVLCCGGGGVPVSVRMNRGTGQLEFIPHDAVIDKDRTSALLAKNLQAHNLIIYTAHDGVSRPEDFERHGKEAPVISRIHWAEALDLVNQMLRDDATKGSIGPKLGACVDFVMYMDLDERPSKAVICGPKTVADVLLRNDFSGCTQIV